jgi:hypothetical protein
MNPGQDGAAFKRLLTGRTESEIKANITKYFGLADQWFIDHGYSLAIFAKQYDGIRMRDKNANSTKRTGNNHGGMPDSYRRQLADFGLE